jgi:Pyridoxamine 5'-phosphate oxidase
MDRKELMDFFNHRPRNCLLVTSNDQGKVNVAVYGSPTMIDENTVLLSTRENRSYQYLRKNPQAAMIVVEPGEISRASKGIRIYLEMTAIETVGELLDKFKVEVGRRAGKEAAEGIKAAIRFKITEVRPLVDPIA